MENSPSPTFKPIIEKIWNFISIQQIFHCICVHLFKWWLQIFETFLWKFHFVTMSYFEKWSLCLCRKKIVFRRIHTVIYISWVNQGQLHKIAICPTNWIISDPVNFAEKNWKDLDSDRPFASRQNYLKKLDIKLISNHNHI